jgi:tetratricopeptide (TPR) repeat protein
MTTLAEALARTARALRDERDLDVGLDRLLTGPPPAAHAQWLGEVLDTLDERVDSLRVARKELKKLVALTKHLAQIMPFTTEGWPAEHERLAELAERDPPAGLAAWLTDWFAAAGRAHLDALDRLQTAELALPAGSGQLVDRAFMAANGIAQSNWHLVEPMLAAERAGLGVRGHRVALTDAQRLDLDLLAARMAIRCGLTDAAQAALARAATRGDETDLVALRHRLQRTTGAPTVAPGAADVARRLADARAADPANLDVAVELIVAAYSSAPDSGAAGSGGVVADAALDVARSTIEALASLADIDAELALVMTDLPDEIYIAVAERAIAEHDWGLALTMLDKTGDAKLHELNALAAEHRAQAIAGQAGPISERGRALVMAGDYRTQAGQYDRARTDYGRALEIDPQDVEATLGEAEVLRLSSSGGPPAALLAPMRRVAAVVANLRDRGEMTTEHSWGYLIESSAWMEAGRYAGVERDEVLWRSLLAAARGAAHRPDLSSRWQAIADAANPLNMHETALLCAEKSGQVTVDLDPAATLVVARCNAARHDAALATIDEMSSSTLAPTAWISTARAALLLRNGHAKDAFRILQGTEIKPSWFWSRSDFIDALIASGQGAAAVSAAESLLRDLEHLQDDYGALIACAFAANVCGRPRDAQLWAERLRDAGPRALMGGSTALIRAEAALVQGDLDAHVEEIEEAVSCFGRDEASGWTAIERKRLEFLAQRAGVELPDLAALDAKVAERIAALSKLDGTGELMLAAEGHGSGPVMETRMLLLPLLLWAQGDLESARLAMQDAEHESGGDAELARLREHLARPVAEPPTVEQHEVAAESSQARRGLVQRAEVGLQLPPSWFRDLPNPLGEHPLFLRFLPEMRARLGRNGPAVTVGIDERLEPDKYVILIDQEAVVEGRVARDWRYCPTDAVALMPVELSGSFERDPALDLMRIPLREARTANGIAQLLLLPAEEVVARIVGDTATRFADRIGAADLAVLPQT